MKKIIYVLFIFQFYHLQHLKDLTIIHIHFQVHFLPIKQEILISLVKKITII